MVEVIDGIFYILAVMILMLGIWMQFPTATLVMAGMIILEQHIDWKLSR